MKSCYCCGSEKTAIHRDGYPQWNINKDNTTGELIGYLCSNCYSNIRRGIKLGVNRRYHECVSCGVNSENSDTQWYATQKGVVPAMCKNCYAYLIHNHEWNKITNPKRLAFKTRRVFLPNEIRIGVCNLCRAVGGIDTKYTHMHHEQYDEYKPAANTIEVCMSCHPRRQRGLI